MRTIWHSLLWKEWHEHKWKLASLTVILVAALFVFGSSGLDLYVLRSMKAILLFYCVLAGTFLGMSTAGGESGRKTLPFLQSLPTPMWQPGVTKLTMAILTAVLPLLVLAGVIYVWWTFLKGPGELELQQLEGRLWSAADFLAAGTLGATLGVSSLVLWMAAAGLNRSDEIRAGAVGFLVIILVWLVFYLGICLVWFVLENCFDQADERHLLAVENGSEILLAAMPGAGGVAIIHMRFQSGHYPYLPLILTAIIGHGSVLVWYLRRFGRVVPRPARTEGNVSSVAWSKNQRLGPPKRSQFTAIAWKQARELGPLALVAVVGIFMMATVFYLYNYKRVDAKAFGEGLAGITLSMAFFVTIVAGIGVFLEDLKPGVDEFWRSRPINFPLWFGVKFMVGMLVLVATFGTLILLAYWLTDSELLSREQYPLVMVGLSSLAFLLIYTLSIATYCILRQPIYTAVLTFGLFIAGIFVLKSSSFHIVHESSHGAVTIALMLLLQTIVTTLAWLAVRHNWRWKNN